VADSTEDLADRFVALAKGRNFLSFEELEAKLSVPRHTILALKHDFEAALRKQEPRTQLTSRIDLDPPGFEISD